MKGNIRFEVALASQFSHAHRCHHRGHQHISHLRIYTQRSMKFPQQSQAESQQPIHLISHQTNSRCSQFHAPKRNHT